MQPHVFTNTQSARQRARNLVVVGGNGASEAALAEVVLNGTLLGGRGLGEGS